MQSHWGISKPPIGVPQAEYCIGCGTTTLRGFEMPYGSCPHNESSKFGAVPQGQLTCSDTCARAC